MENLCITAFLRTAVVSDQWLPLDGMLLYQATRDEIGSQDVSQPGASYLAQPKGEPMRGRKLPLATVHAKDWYYKCSWAEWGPHADGTDYWNKRFDAPLADLVDFNGRRGKIDISAAEYKAYHMPVFYRSALWIKWYAVGDRAGIEYLLSTLTHVGKKSSQGWGRVARWQVEAWPEDWSVLRDGHLTRGVPIYHAPRGQERVMGLYGVRPSYWDRRNQMELVMP